MQIATDAVGVMVGQRGRRSRGHFQHDADAHSTFWRKGYELLAALPEKPQAQSRAGARRRDDPDARAARRAKIFMRQHASAVYAALTKNQTQFVRADVLAYEAANARSRPRADARAGRCRRARRCRAEKDGIEVDQGIFFAHILARPDTGTHFCHAMLLPRAEVARAARRIHSATARSIFGTAAVDAAGQGRDRDHAQSALPQCRGRRRRLQQTEIAVDLAILDPMSEICVLRGDMVDNPKYAGKRVFSTGINLTHLYHGKIPYLWYVTREMGFVNKMLRGARAARHRARTRSTAARSRSRGSPASRTSRSAAAASICSRWITWWRRATPT